MKKIAFFTITVILVFCMLAGITACSGKENTLICGVTDYAPMNFKDTSGKWTGFDTEFAELVGKKLDMKVEFQEIKWENKYSELESGAINCIWNGFTANSSDDGKKRSEYVDFSYSYMLNQQCVVVKEINAANFTKIEDLSGKKAAAEQGSAGEETARKAVGDSGTVIGASVQNATFTEVKSGAVDFAVVDILLAQKFIGTGDYSDLVIAEIEMDSEVYAIGFKKNSDLTGKVNDAMVELYEDGSLAKLANKYNLENNLKLDTNFKG